jgi:hypothetical protein
VPPLRGALVVHVILLPGERSRLHEGKVEPLEPCPRGGYLLPRHARLLLQGAEAGGGCPALLVKIVPR